LSFRESIAAALDAVLAHKLRSLLTILGVVIGIVSVVGMVSLIQGLNASMSRQIQALGSNVIYVTRNPPGIRMGGRTTAERARPDVTYDDARAIMESVKAAGAVSPENTLGGNARVVRGSREADFPMLTGVLPDYLAVRNVSMASGRFISDGDQRHGLKVCVLGARPAEALFPGENPLGRNVTIDGRAMRVIGVLEERGRFLARDRDNIVLLPYRTYAHLHPEEKGLLLAVKPVSPGAMARCMDEITAALRLHRGVDLEAENNFYLSTQDSLNETYDQVTRGIYLAMILISSIGLLVGGVGVMNIMLVSVRERTREIGLRKAVGARRTDVVRQFLIEAIVLTGTGGIIGIGLGIVTSRAVDTFSPLPSTVSPIWLTIAFSVSVSVGLFFGLYPAIKAARLDPIAALRYE